MSERHDDRARVEGAGTSTAVQGRVKQLRAQVADTTSDCHVGRSPGGMGGMWSLVGVVTGKETRIVVARVPRG
jgi:hypothetical protein